MSRSNYDKPFYVDIGTSMVSIRCASNNDVIWSRDHVRNPTTIKLLEDACERMNREVEGLETVKLRQALGACIIQMCERCCAAAELDGLNVPCVVGCETLRMAKEALEGTQETKQERETKCS